VSLLSGLALLAPAPRRTPPTSHHRRPRRRPGRQASDSTPLERQQSASGRDAWM